jgi:hypothetical protein
MSLYGSLKPSSLKQGSLKHIMIDCVSIEGTYTHTSYGGGFAALWRYRDRSSQEYLTPGCQVLGGYKKLGTLPDMISSSGSHFAVLDHVKII